MKLAKYIPANYPSNFITELQQVAARLGTKPDYLLAIIKHESNFNTYALNPKTNAVGLIQFMPATLSAWGYSTADVYHMNALEQLYLIEKYFTPYKSWGLNNVYKIFGVTFYPYMVRYKWTQLSYIIGSEKSMTYASYVANGNPGFDLNNDGYITLREYKKYHKEYLKTIGLVNNNMLLYIGAVVGTFAVYKKMKK